MADETKPLRAAPCDVLGYTLSRDADSRVHAARCCKYRPVHNGMITFLSTTRYPSPIDQNQQDSVIWHNFSVQVGHCFERSVSRMFLERNRVPVTCRRWVVRRRSPNLIVFALAEGAPILLSFRRGIETSFLESLGASVPAIRPLNPTTSPSLWEDRKRVLASFRGGPLERQSSLYRPSPKARPSPSTLPQGGSKESRNQTP